MQNKFIFSPFFLDKHTAGLEEIAKPEWQINKPDLPEGDQQTRMSAIHQPLADFVSETASAGNRPISISGDCCSAIAVLAGLQRVGLSPVILWLDAHGDFNTRETTPSNFLGGMPLAMMVGRGKQTMLEAVGLKPYSEIRIILTDGRDLDPGEREALNNSSIVHLAEATTLLEHPLLGSPLYIHFDTDIINPEDAPAMNYPAPGGPSAEELKHVFQHIAQRGQVLAASMSTWNPELDKDGKSREVCMELLEKLIDKD